MKASFTPTGRDGKIASNRKEKHFAQQLTAVALIGGELKDVIQARIYRTANRHYSCIWIHSNPVHLSGGGYAGGYGYHRPSAALQNALGDAGVVLSECIAGRGDGAMREALEAIMRELGYTVFKIFNAHA